MMLALLSYTKILVGHFFWTFGTSFFTVTRFPVDTWTVHPGRHGLQCRSSGPLPRQSSCRIPVIPVNPAVSGVGLSPPKVSTCAGVLESPLPVSTLDSRFGATPTSSSPVPSERPSPDLDPDSSRRRLVCVHRCRRFGLRA